jgi:hypothetical protein
MSAGNVRFCGNVVLVSVRYALATGATALAVAIVLPSQPFLAVLAAYLLVAKPSRGNDLAGLPTGMERCCGGSGFGRVLPQQFWLLLPAFQPTCPPRAPRHSPDPEPATAPPGCPEGKFGRFEGLGSRFGARRDGYPCGGGLRRFMWRPDCSGCSVALRPFPGGNKKITAVS